MFDAKALLEKFLGGDAGKAAQALTEGKWGGFAGGAAAAGLAAILLGTRSGRSIAGGALRAGGIAALGALAYKAFRDWQAGRAAGEPAQAMPGAIAHSAPVVVAPPTGSAFAPEGAAAATHGIAILRAVIAAAKADGHIDEAERSRIAAALDKAGLSSEERQFVTEEIGKPLDIAAVVAGATSPELAAQIYAASLLAMEPDQPAERAYLDLLAGRLNLDPQLVAHIRANAGK